MAFVLLRNSRFNFHCYTQREATPTQKSARKCRCDLSQLLARKITKGIHSCKPASLNRSIALYRHFLKFGYFLAHKFVTFLYEITHTVVKGLIIRVFKPTIKQSAMMYSAAARLTGISSICRTRFGFDIVLYSNRWQCFVCRLFG